MDNILNNFKALVMHDENKTAFQLKNDFEFWIIF